MDKTAKLWDLETGKLFKTLIGHKGEVISINFNAEGDKVMTGSFDGTAKIWDVKSGKTIFSFEEHT